MAEPAAAVRGGRNGGRGFTSPLDASFLFHVLDKTYDLCSIVVLYVAEMFARGRKHGTHQHVSSMPRQLDVIKSWTFMVKPRSHTVSPRVVGVYSPVRQMLRRRPVSSKVSEYLGILKLNGSRWIIQLAPHNCARRGLVNSNYLVIPACIFSFPLAFHILRSWFRDRGNIWDANHPFIF